MEVNALYIRVYSLQHGIRRWDVCVQWDADLRGTRAELRYDSNNIPWWAYGSSRREATTFGVLVFLKLSWLGSRVQATFMSSDATFAEMVRANPAAYPTRRAGLERYLDLLHGYGIVSVPGAVLAAEAMTQAQLREQSQPYPSDLVQSVNYSVVN